MLLKSFYEVEPKAYLFDRNEGPKERVRQWVLFELLSTYGFKINDIKIEVQCKLGSKYYPADVVIYQNHSPIIVIGCKRHEEEDVDEALKQAVSYANYLKAEFVLITNGNHWIAKRNLNGEWIGITDIPSHFNLETQETITSTLRFVDRIKPVLYWMYQEIPKEHAREFFFFLNEFFRPEYSSTRADRDLQVVVDSLLRILGGSGFQQLEFEITEYEMEKIEVAIRCCESFINKAGVGLSSFGDDFKGHDFRALLGGLTSQLDEILSTQKDLDFDNIMIIRMANSIIKQLWKVFESGKYQNISSITLREIEVVINKMIMSKLGVRLPDTSEAQLIEEMMGFSSSKWKLDYRKKS
jgi:hypothetical protein